MNYAKIKPVDVANGEGVRVSIFVCGCRHFCKGCFNRELWNHAAGELFTSNTIKEIFGLLKKPYITGLSLLGGEPLDPYNVRDSEWLCDMVKRHTTGKDIWCYTGYRWEDVKDLKIMKDIDIIVDGRFIEELKDPRLKFRGSSNQRIIDVKKSLKSGCVVLRKDLMV